MSDVGILVFEVDGFAWECAVVRFSDGYVRDGNGIDPSDYKELVRCRHRHRDPDNRTANRCANRLYRRQMAIEESKRDGSTA